MSGTTVDMGQVVSCDGTETLDWYAWNDLQPPRPDHFHVVGEVRVGNPGISVILRPRVPQGPDPRVLSLELILIQQAGVWPQIATWVPVRYDKVLLNRKFGTVEVYCEGTVIAEFPVEDVH